MFLFIMFIFKNDYYLLIKELSLSMSLSIKSRFDEKIKSSRAFTISKYTKFSAFSTQQFQPVFRRRRLDRSSILAKCATEHKRIKKKFCRVNKEISFHLTVPPTIITTPQHSYIYTIYIYI